MDDAVLTDDEKINKLISEFQTLSTFKQVGSWAKRAGVEIQRMAGIVRALDIEIARAAEELERAKYEQAQKSLVGRLFSGGAGNDEKGSAQKLEQLRQRKAEASKVVTQLQDWVDFTPASLEQQKELVLELRVRSREVQEKKREITTVIRGPRGRMQAQEEQPTVFDAETLKRRKARYAREEELLPGEKTAEALSRQLAQIDKDIQWAQKFTG